MQSNTAEGLRSRLFIALDGAIDKTISNQDVENICYISEQIIKTAKIELEIIQEANIQKDKERTYQLQMKREEKETIALLGRTIDETRDIQSEEDAA